ncbi:MAG: glycosyltransferase family 2 protein [Flavobacterium sp.]
MSLVSIIIPTYNRANLICYTLDSVLKQSYQNWECIIVDDGSTDETFYRVKKYIESDDRFFLYNRPIELKKGPSSCRNFGVEKSNGTYLLFLDSDDWLTADCLERRIEFVSKHINYDLFVFKTSIVYEGMYCELHQSDTFTNDLKYFEKFKEGKSPFYIHSCLWKKQFFNFLNGFDVNLVRLEDPDLYLRFFINGGVAKTNWSGKIDSFYRKDAKRLPLKSEELISHYYYFHKKHYSILIHHIKDFFKSKILTSNSIKYYLKYSLLLLKYKPLNYKYIFFIPLLLVYKLLKLNKVKGTGFSMLTNLTFDK